MAGASVVVFCLGLVGDPIAASPQPVQVQGAISGRRNNNFAADTVHE